jgi:hypothetical protein
MEMFITARWRVRLCCAANASIGRILHAKEMGGPVNYGQKKPSFAISAWCGYLGWANRRKIVLLNEGVYLFKLERSSSAAASTDSASAVFLLPVYD